MGAVPPALCCASPLGTFATGPLVATGLVVSPVPRHGELGWLRAGDAAVSTKDPIGTDR